MALAVGPLSSAIEHQRSRMSAESASSLLYGERLPGTRQPGIRSSADCSNARLTVRETLRLLGRRMARAPARTVSTVRSGSCTHYRLSPEMVTRSGALAVAGLLLVPLAAFGARRDWGALVLGGTTAMLILLLVPWVFPHFADAVSISQARRAAGFLPLPFAAVGGLAMLGRGRGQLAVALALAAGIGLELLYPGWFGSAAPRGAPSYPAWVALGGGIAVLLLAGMLPSNRSRPRGGLTLVLVALVAAPAAVRGLSEWTTTPQPTSSPLTDGVVRELRTARFRGTIVYSDPGTSYWIASAAPVFIATAPPSHVANTIANDPYRRWDAGARFLRTGSLAIPRRYRACTILLRRPARIRLHLPVIYRDTGFVLYALQPNCSQTD